MHHPPTEESYVPSGVLVGALSLAGLRREHACWAGLPDTFGAVVPSLTLHHGFTSSSGRGGWR